MNRDAGVERVLRNVVDLFYGADVNLVIDVETLDVLPVTLDSVNEVVYIVVASEDNVSIVDLVLMQHVLNHLPVDLGQCLDSVELQATSLLRSNGDVWLLLVQPDADLLQFKGQLGLLSLSFGDVQHHKNEIGRLADADDLSSTAFAV